MYELFKKFRIIIYLCNYFFSYFDIIYDISYFNILKDGGVAIFKIIIPIISLFIGGFLLGKKASKKGWLEGIKIGALCLIFMIIFNYLAYSFSFEVKNLLYYSILIISSIFGSMIGINFKKNNVS